MIDINIPGEDGASPLLYAARFRANLQVSQVNAGGENGTVPDGVVESNIGVVAAPLTHAISSSSLLVEVNQAMSQVWRVYVVVDSNEFWIKFLWWTVSGKYLEVHVHHQFNMFC